MVLTWPLGGAQQNSESVCLPLSPGCPQAQQQMPQTEEDKTWRILSFPTPPPTLHCYWGGRVSPGGEPCVCRETGPREGAQPAQVAEQGACTTSREAPSVASESPGAGEASPLPCHPSPSQGLAGYPSTSPPAPSPSRLTQKARPPAGGGGKGLLDQLGHGHRPGSERRQEGSCTAGVWGHHCLTWGRGHRQLPSALLSCRPPWMAPQLQRALGRWALPSVGPTLLLTSSPTQPQFPQL